MSALPDLQTLADGVRSGRRAALSRAITLVESTRDDHRRTAAQLLDRLAPETGGAVRIGLSGVPGAGKSTLLDSFGTFLTGIGHKVAVLAVDPSSVRTGGSILGDKTRMRRLSVDPNAFVRPSPSSGTLGGVAARTRETLLLCEAAGFDVVIVETMGVGQAEVKVSDMVDVVVLLMIAGGGDDLQGIKKGILEIADIVAINKADGDRAKASRKAAAEMRSALSILAPRSTDWTTRVMTLSGLEGTGLSELWSEIERHRDVHRTNGSLSRRRAEQREAWLEASLEEALRRRVLSGAAAQRALEAARQDVREGGRAPSALAENLLDALGIGTTTSS